jgi:carbamoyltransferase
MYILGISSFYHDSAACLLKDGEIAASAQEERFTRKKHDHNFPSNAIHWCLGFAGITAAELGLVIFYDKPLIRFERILRNSLAFTPSGVREFILAAPLWYKQDLRIADLIKGELGYKGKVIFSSRHESQVAAAFYPSPFQEAAFLIIDGAADRQTVSFGTGKGRDIKILSSMSFPHSPGLLYSAFTYYAGFRVNSGEYKLMGLAPYGRPKYADLILDNLISLKDDGTFKLDTRYFNYSNGVMLTNRRFEELFGGPPRKPETEITQKDMDVSASIQQVTEEIILRMARQARKVTGQDKLCLAGEVALNCVANGRILRDGCFKEIWVQPASGDAAGALGAAFVAWHKHLGNKRQADNKNDRLKGSFLGPSFSDEYIEDLLKKNDIPYRKLAYPDIPQAVANLIEQDNVIGWFEGALEFGPRALGARSILADARNKELRSRMNLKVKFRESFRPFAPTVLAEHASKWFDLGCQSPYMLLVAPVREEARLAIPAVTHVDNSARVQTIKREAHPLYYDTIDAFYKKTGCPVVINTSFNVRGEPLVCRPEDAIRCFMRAEMDYLIMGCFLLDKRHQKPVENDKDWQKGIEPD